MQKIKSKPIIITIGILTFLTWSTLNIFSIWQNINTQKEITLKMAKNTAYSNFKKDQAFRQWSTNHGGVYVKPTKKTPPSPWMAHIEDRDITTTEGKKLTLMNPAYMLREMMDDFSDLYGIKGKIAGIVYLNPNNKADKWEENAIRKFERGEKEVAELTGSGDDESFRLIGPMVMREKCQKCHGHLGFKNGSIRGGVSISVPMKRYRIQEKKAIDTILMTYIFIWGLGSIAITMFTIFTHRYNVRRQEELDELMISSQVIDNMMDIVFITDKDGTILRINDAFTLVTGYSEEDAVGKKPNILRSEHHNNEFYKNLWNSILKYGEYHGEIWNRRKSGEIFISIQNIATIKETNGNIKYFVATLHDITERKHVEERNIHLAHYDPLTDLPNRTLFKIKFNHAIKIAKRTEKKVALLFLDIDGFKSVNDTKGHPVGDKLLIEIAKRLKENLRESDTISRLGGDEFTFILENVNSINEIIPKAEKILKLLSEEFNIESYPINVSCSIGVSIYPNDGDTSDNIIQNADTAMYKAKENGKNRFCFYETSMTVRALEKIKIKNDLYEAIKNEEFLTYYQPKVDTNTKSIIGLEALVRWIDKDNNMIPPDKFIPIAEELHVVNQIDLFVLKQVCIDIHTWINAGYKDIKVSVNLSGYDLTTKNLLEDIIKITKEHNVLPSNLEFEITETYFVELTNKNILHRFLDYGFTLSIDDFGTGFSSLNSLNNMPANILKIDKSFVDNIETNAKDVKLIKMIINIADIFSLKVIAEGVETKEQFELLKELKCDYIQGYFISRPLPKDEIDKFLNIQEVLD